ARPPRAAGGERAAHPVRRVPPPGRERRRRPAAGGPDGAGPVAGLARRGRPVRRAAAGDPAGRRRAAAVHAARRRGAGGADRAPGVPLVRRAGAALARRPGHLRHVPGDRRHLLPVRAVQRLVHGSRDRRAQPRRHRPVRPAAGGGGAARAGHLERPVALARPRPGRAERGRAALVREGRRDGDRPPHRVAPVPHPSGQGGEGGADLPGRVVLDRPAHLGRRHPGLPSVLRQPAAQAELHATTLRGVARRSRRWFCWPMAELVLSSLDRGVLTLTFNRPDRLNAWTEELGRRYFDLLAEAEKDPQVRAIVVTGAGRGFCAGADFEALAAIQQGTYASEPDPRPNTFPTTIAKPVIAAVNGACAGLGMVHALMCDLVFTAEDAKWTTAFARRGLVAEYGLGWVLPRVMGQQRAMDVLLSGRTFSGREACELGLALRAVPG